MKSTNEGFMKNMFDKALGRSTDDDLKKRGAEFGKAVAAEEFFQLDDGRSQGAKGLVLSMLDAMTPDHNVEYKGTGVEEGDAVDYVRGYLKKSWLGEIDAQPNKGKSEDADFAKYIDNNAWGEKITFNSLIQATTELYDRLRAEKMFEADIMLKYYSVPAGLLFYCLRNLGRSLMDMKKRYELKRPAAGIEENKILKEYIMQNTPQQPEDVSIIEIIADEVNETLNNLPEVQLASEILSEDELKNLFSPLARQVVERIRGQIGEKIKGMVAEAVTIEEFLGMLQTAGGGETIEATLQTMTDAELQAVRQIIEREDEGSSYLNTIDDEVARRAAEASGEEELDEPVTPEEDPPSTIPDFEVKEDE